MKELELVSLGLEVLLESQNPHMLQRKGCYDEREDYY